MFFRTEVGGASRLDPSSPSYSERVFVVACVTILNYANTLIKSVPVSSPAYLPKHLSVVLTAFNP